MLDGLPDILIIFNNRPGSFASRTVHPTHRQVRFPMMCWQWGQCLRWKKAPAPPLPYMKNFDMIAVVGLTAGAILIAWQILARFSKSRISLKHDLEILNLLPPTSVYADKLRKRVEARLKKNYGDGDATSWFGFTFAAVIFVVFAVVTYMNFVGDRMMVGAITSALCLLSLLSAVCQISPSKE